MKKLRDMMDNIHIENLLVLTDNSSSQDGQLLSSKFSNADAFLANAIDSERTYGG